MEENFIERAMGINYYAYMRVSTTQQDISRQKQAINDFVSRKSIEIDEWFTDYYTGTTFDRENYQKLMSRIKSGDYLIVKEVDRLGRNWDLIKKEWTKLQDRGIKIIIIDLPILSDSLPGEPELLTGLTGRLIKEQMLTLMCYSAQLERDKISQRTKEALREKMINGTKSGKPIGRPTNKRNTKENLIKTLELMVNGVSQYKAAFETTIPIYSLKYQLRRLYNLLGTKNYDIILKYLKEENNV